MTDSLPDTAEIPALNMDMRWVLLVIAFSLTNNIELSGRAQGVRLALAIMMPHSIVT
jgi:hypothetical protein